MNDNSILHKYISDYLELQKRTYVIGDEFAYASYTAPNTMFQVSNSFPKLLRSLNERATNMALDCIDLLKRNHDPVMAITVFIPYKLFKDDMSIATFNRAIKSLLSVGFLIKTPKKSIYIVNPEYVNKLYKPKIDI